MPAHLVKGRVFATVVKTTDQPLTWLDKLKSYYQVAITVVGTLLVALNQLTPVFAFFPASKGVITIAIAVLTALATLLKSNEQWVVSGEDDKWAGDS
jgi:hypothetical protein